MNELETNYAAAVLNLTDRLERKRDRDEWEERMHKIEQNCHIKDEYDNQENEEE